MRDLVDRLREHNDALEAFLLSNGINIPPDLQPDGERDVEDSRSGQLRRFAILEELLQDALEEAVLNPRKHDLNRERGIIAPVKRVIKRGWWFMKTKLIPSLFDKVNKYLGAIVGGTQD